LALFLCACSGAIIKPSPAPVCEIPAELANSCELPNEIGASLSYGQLIELDLKTREKLSLCASRFNKLKESYQRCTEMLQRYNAGIAEAEQNLAQKRSSTETSSTRPDKPQP
jgi:hypothetical protein